MNRLTELCNELHSELQHLESLIRDFPNNDDLRLAARSLEYKLERMQLFESKGFKLILGGKSKGEAA